MAADKHSHFPTTHWTLVQSIRHGDVTESHQALGELCQRYWYPVYAFLRRSGRSEEDAEDLTQAFFTKLISEDTLQAMEPDAGHGKLRSFLLAVLTRMLVDEKRHRTAEKRGGGIPNFSLDQLEAEKRYRYEPVDVEDPEKLFWRAWANNLVATTRDRMKAVFEKQNREALFEMLEPHLISEEGSLPYVEMANRLDSTEGAVRLLVHRTRKRFRTELEKEVANTIADSSELENEMDWLKNTLAGSLY